jgi:hypothetical protein
VPETESNETENAEGSLLWDCFMNWSITLEKLEKKTAEGSGGPGKRSAQEDRR